MDLYKIICPYCKHASEPYDDELTGYRAVTCVGCGKPYMIHTQYVLAHQSYALAGLESNPSTPDHEPEPTPAIMGTGGTIVVDEPEEKAETARTGFEWKYVPGTCATYHISPTHVVLRYQKCGPIRVGWYGIGYLLTVERKNRKAEILRILMDKANTRQMIAIDMFTRAVEHGRIPEYSPVVI